MNPPFNDPARQRASPDDRRRLAHAGSGAALPVCIKTAARLLRPHGTLAMIWRADGLADVLQALAPAFGAVAVLPVHPGEEKAAIRVLLRATKASRAPLVLLPGFVLNDRSGRPTAQAESVLRAGAALPLSEI
jgi:tRNA1(Val) A37 N6-methylase TrmN6